MGTYEVFVDGDPTGILIQGDSAEVAWDKAVEDVEGEYSEIDELEVRNISDASDSYTDYLNDG